MATDDKASNLGVTYTPNITMPSPIVHDDKKEELESPQCCNTTLIIETNKSMKIEDLTKSINIHQIADDKSIVVPGGEVGPGGDYNEYTILGFNNEQNEATVLGELNFQRGPIKDVGENGAQMEHYIVAMIHRLECFQAGKYKSTYNAEALTHLYNALRSLQQRTLDRITLGVEGTYKTGDVEKDIVVKTGDLSFNEGKVIFTIPENDKQVKIIGLNLAYNGNVTTTVKWVGLDKYTFKPSIDGCKNEYDVSFIQTVDVHLPKPITLKAHIKSRLNVETSDIVFSCHLSALEDSDILPQTLEKFTVDSYILNVV